MSIRTEEAVEPCCAMNYDFSGVSYRCRAIVLYVARETNHFHMSPALKYGLMSQNLVSARIGLAGHTDL
ncbi:hypothetical protein KS4_32300 [Poriferisphaera corsica]|uniref:Uncharacterized protein n=1 Tax=Poriferisphaera corsica TaxID=2528020 RepID=A0A517YY39_9BACT|nr:hypothetical protein KS4_32300 [Poriferisphaera corsica]